MPPKTTHKNLLGGWKSARLADILEKMIDYRGQSVPKAEVGIPLITARNVREGYLDFYDKEFIDESKYDLWMTRGIPKGGDILFTTEAPLGMVCKFPSDQKYAVGQRIITLRANEENILSNFLLHFLLSPYGKGVVDFRSTGSTAKGIKSSELKKIKIVFPEKISEQNRIVAVLETWDRAIESLAKKIEIKKQIKKGLMQELLTGKTRLKGFSEKWKNCTLNDLIESFSTGLNPRENFKLGDGENYYVTIKNISNGKINLLSAEKITDEAMRLINKRSKLDAGDIIMSSIGNVGEAYLVQKKPKNWDINESVFCLKPNQKLTRSDFIYYLIVSEDTKKYFANNITGSSFKSIKMKELRSMPTSIPPIEEQAMIVNILLSSDDEISSLEKKLTLLKDQKKYLLNNLITGEIRTPENLTLYP